jgi:hypothetical protein
MPGWAAITTTSGISAIIASTSADTDPQLRGMIHIAPTAALADIRPGPYAIASAMVAGRRRRLTNIRANLKSKGGFPLIGESARIAAASDI